MNQTVLVVTHPQDLHAFLVEEVLKRKGCSAALVHTSDFPQRLWKTVAGSTGHRFRSTATDLMEPLPEVVWWRRPTGPVLPSWLHPKDTEFAQNECKYFVNWFWESLADHGFWVNPYSTRLSSENKILQQRAAVAAGFEVPPTLYSNDPEEIRRFLRGQGGRVVYKPFSPHYAQWAEEGRAQALYTALVSEDDLPADEVLSATAGIFQAHIPKANELRIVAFGRRLFAVRIDSQETEKGKLDFREAYDELALEVVDLSPPLTAACLSVLDRLGIVTGSFDVIVTPDGRHVFLEVNPQGQFLWIEAFTGLPLLDAFAEFLIQRDVNFQWRESARSVRLGEVEEIGLHNQEVAKSEHVLAYPEVTMDEDACSSDKESEAAH